MSQDNSLHTQRLERAQLALEGLSIGDALGGFFELSSPDNLSHFVQTRTPPRGIWRYTDDTEMALSIFLVLRTKHKINQDTLAESFAEHFDRTRGYGRSVRSLVARMKRGESWQEANRDFFGSQGSYGNGGAMRVAPVGAYFADDMTSLVENARLSAEITHAHPEGIAGAIAVAAACAIAWQMRGAHITRPDFIEQVLAFFPEGEVKAGCIAARDLPAGTSVRQTVAVLGNGSDMSAEKTIPFVLWCAGENLSNYEEAIWQTLSGGGDADTNAAIVGGIVALHVGLEGIPAAWREQREMLPIWAF